MPVGTFRNTYLSPEEKYVLYDFQRRENARAADVALAAIGAPEANPEPSPILILSGETGSGRSYLLEAAAHRTRWDGRPVLLLPLDLSGFEESLGAVGFLDKWLERHTERTKEIRAERLGRLRRVAESLPASLPGATLVALGLEWFSLAESLSDLAPSTFETLAGPQRPPRESLRALLDELSQQRRLVLHVERSADLDDVTRWWLLEEAARNPHLLLAISCHPTEATDQTAPRARTTRLELDPLSPAEVHAALSEAFAPNDFPLSLADALALYGRGNPAQMALKMQDLVVAEAVASTHDGGWTLAADLDDPAIASHFAAELLDPFRAKLHALPVQLAARVERFLDLAALCGELVPVRLLADHLELSDDERDELIDWIDVELIENEETGLFVDRGFAHPSLPGLVYEFANPILPSALRDEIPASRRFSLASDLLKFLRHMIPSPTRGLAHLFLQLAQVLDTEEERGEIRRELAWWVGLDEAEALRDQVAEDLQEGRVAPEMVLEIISADVDRWLPQLRLAPLEAITTSRAPIPSGWLSQFHFYRARCFHELSDDDQALPEATLSEDMARTDNSQKEWVALAMSLRGQIMHAKGDLSGAKSLLTESLNLFRSLLPPNHPSIAAGLNNLGLVLHALGDLEESRRYIEEALAVFRLSLHPNHPSIANVLKNLGDVLGDLGDLEGARRYHEKALAISRLSLPPNHPSIAARLNSLGTVLHGLGALEEAQRHHDEALAIARLSLPPNHPSIAAGLSNLGTVLRDLGDLEGARRHHEEALAIERRSLPPNHPSIAVSLSNLGTALRDLGDLEGARRHHEEAHAIRCLSLPPEHPDIAVASTYMALVLRDLQVYPEAECLFTDSVQRLTAMLGPDHHRVVRAWREWNRGPAPALRKDSAPG